MAGLKLVTKADRMQRDYGRVSSAEHRAGLRHDAHLYRNERDAFALASSEVHAPDARRKSAGNKQPHLTGREKQVLGLIVAGRLSKQIAAELQISPRTVELHRSRIMRKLGASNIAQLMRMVMCAGCAQRLAAITA